MKKVLFVVFLIGSCFGQESLKTQLSYKNDVSFDSKRESVQVGYINEFVLDQGYPFKKPSVFGKATSELGKLKEFVLYRGYPSKIKLDQTISNFKIIGEF